MVISKKMAWFTMILFPFDYYEQLSMISFKNEEKSLNELNIFFCANIISNFKKVTFNVISKY